MCAFQILSYVDELKLFSLNDDIDIDDNDLLQVLHCILSLILFHHYVRKLSNKRRIIVRVLAMESNLVPLLHFLEFSGIDERLCAFLFESLSNRRWRKFEKQYSNTIHRSNCLRIICNTRFSVIIRAVWLAAFEYL